MSEGKVKQLALKNITVDTKCQSRADGLDEATVKEYVEALEGGAEFPPLVVYHDSANTNWLSEGFHRIEAYTRHGVKVVPVEMRPGNREAAILNSVGSNSAHGLRRTNADKRHCVALVLELHPDWTSTKIAEAIGVSDEFVRKNRPRAAAGETRTGKDGKQHPANKPKTNQVPTVGTSDKPTGDATTTQPSKPDDVTSNSSSDAVTTNGAPEGTESEPEDAGKAFVDRVEAMCREMDQLSVRMKALKTDPHSYSMHIDSALSQVTAARQTMWQGRPCYPCPYCEANGSRGCDVCKTTMRVKKAVRESGLAATGGVVK